MIEWKNIDPRNELVGMKRAEIIIVRPSIDHNFSEIGLGYCEMKNGWSVHTSFEYNEIVGDKWDDAWYWTLFNDPIRANNESISAMEVKSQ